ncbi:MAPEG family protein [Luteimonas sp. A537]
MPQALVLPMAAHVTLTAFLYALLTVARAPAVWGLGRRADGSNPWSAIEPRISANLSNQFEWPLFFHVACLFFLQFQTTQTVVALAWIFVGGRILHSAIQVFTSNVRLRGLVFTVNFLAVIGLWYFVVSASGKAAAA